MGSITSTDVESSGTAQARPDFSEMTDEEREAMREEMAAMQDEAESKNELLVLIEYTDSTGQRLSVEKSVQVEELSGGTMAAGTGPGIRKQQSSSTNTYLLYGAAILAVVAVGYNYRKKKMQKEGTYVPLGVELNNLKSKIMKMEKQ